MIPASHFMIAVPAQLSGVGIQQWSAGHPFERYEKTNIKYKGYTVYVSAFKNGQRLIKVYGYDNCMFGEFSCELEKIDSIRFKPVLKFKNHCSLTIVADTAFYANDSLTTEVKFKESNDGLLILDMECMMNAVNESWMKIVKFVQENR